MAERSNSYNAANVEAALQALHEPGAVFEVRAPKTPRSGTLSGYFDEPAAAAKAIAAYDGRVPGVYVTLNPVEPALLARAQNRIRARATETTTDKDIVSRRWLLVDIDAERASGISATKDEVEAAFTAATKVRTELAERGWPEPLRVASGNGAHLLYRVDLPNDDAARDLTKRTLEALASRFDSDGCHVDTSVYNAARIVKVPGTLACKGDDTAERPHRRARLLPVPAELVVVPRDKLEALAAAAPQVPQTPAPTSPAPFDLEGFMQRHGLEVRRHKADAGGETWELEVCPFNKEHTRGEAWIRRAPSGALAAGCQHESCFKTWAELREHLEPAGKHKSDANHHEQAATKPAPRARVVRLADVEPQDVAWLWQDRIPLGKIALLIGDPGMAKTTVALDLAARVSIGACLPDGTPGPLGNVVILTAEDGLADTIRPRLDSAGADVSRVFALQAVRDPEKGEERPFCLASDVEALEELVRKLTAVFVIVDPLDAYLAGVDTHRNAEVRTVLAPLAAMLERTGAAGLAVHHLNKDSATVNALYRAGGSLAFVAAARSVLGVALDPEDVAKERRLLLSLKLSLAKKPEGIGYRVGSEGITWDHDPVGVDAAEAFGSPRKADSSTMQAAKDLLREQLAGGRPVAQVLVEEAAAAAGISRPMLSKAKRSLGVRSQLEGFGPAGAWYWSLPDDTP